MKKKAKRKSPGRPISEAGKKAREIAAETPEITAQALSLRTGVSHGLSSRILSEVRRAKTLREAVRR